MSEEVHEIRGIGDYVIDCYTEYGNYVNIHRHVPRWEDGLKPVYKRVMLCALDIACGKKVKTATLIGRTIGCFVGDTELLDVNNQGLKLSDLSKRDLEKYPVYTFSFTNEGVPKISRVLKVWSSGFREDLVRVTLDNGKSFCCTRDHKILTREGYKEAGKLQYMESLIPVTIDEVHFENTRNKSRRIISFNGKSELIYRLSSRHPDCQDKSSGEIKTNIHHQDFNALNDYPSNLVVLDEPSHRSLHGRESLSRYTLNGGLSNRNREKWKESEYREHMSECIKKGNIEDCRSRLLRTLELCKVSPSYDDVYRTARGNSIKLGHKAISELFELLTPDELEKFKITKEKFYEDSIDQSMCTDTSDAGHMWYNQTYRVLRNLSRLGYDKITKELYTSNRLPSSASFELSITKYYSLYNYFGLTPCAPYWSVIKDTVRGVRKHQLVSMLFNAINRCKSLNKGFDSLKEVYLSTRSKKMPRWEYYSSKFPEFVTKEFFDKFDTLIPMNHKVMSVEPVKEGAEVFDVEVDLDEHNFALACGCVAKNCYHPHGDAALNDVIAELVRSGLLIGQGNFGYKSMFRWDDNSPAAPRYTEVKVNPKYETLIKQLLPYVPSHINDLGNIEADYLPTPCVLSLAMGSFGIGLGVTVNIPSFTMESLIKAGYAAILGKPKPWKLLQPGFDLQMSDEDKETFWNNEKGRLTYKFDVEPKTIGGLNGWSIIGDPSFVKPKLQQLFKLKDEGGKVVILDQSHDNIREVFIARSKRIKTITDSEVEMKVREAAEVTKAFSLSVIYNGQTRPITGGTWIQNCMLNYNSLVKRFREDKVNKINLDIEVFTHFREVADRILETEDSYEKIQSDLHLSFGVVEKIAKMSISTLRELDPERRIKKLEGERKYYEDLTTKAVLKEFLK